MKKTKQIHTKQRKMKPEQTLQFLEDFTNLVNGKDTPSKLISIRVPENILNTFKVKAKGMDLKYQSQIVKLMREWSRD